MAKHSLGQLQQQASDHYIRIDPTNGTIVVSDRETHVLNQDSVQWVVVNSTNPPDFTVRFVRSLHPFTPPQNFDIPVRNGSSRKLKVTGPIGDYKYSVLDQYGNPTDDPNVIIDA
jgi:hypothetical protein